MPLSPSALLCPHFSLFLPLPNFFGKGEIECKIAIAFMLAHLFLNAMRKQELDKQLKFNTSHSLSIHKNKHRFFQNMNIQYITMILFSIV